MTLEELNTLTTVEYTKEEVKEVEETGAFVANKTNVVSGEKLRDIQSTTLAETKDYLSKTFGPMGSNTKIVKGQNYQDVSSVYSKDGLKVLGSIINSAPIEASIVEELVDITRAVEKEVGDGTTSTVILSSLIFDKLRVLESKYNVPPFQLCRRFQKIVDKIKEKIEAATKEVTLDDIYNISMISTNGNEEVSQNIRDIYERFGMDVELSVGISNTQDSTLKIYDGLTITEGMSDPVFINNKENNTAEIHDAHIYHFVDPIDTMEQIALFEAILAHNIYDKYDNNEDPIPTVITCPKISKDLSTTLKMLANQLYAFDNQGSSSAKPPILIITNVIASDEVIMDDIANLCGCKSIKKYIDPKVYQKDVEKGVAATPETVADFAGHAELVVADAKKTKFINPDHMTEEDPQYKALVNFLETEIQQEKDTETASSVNLLKKRLSALKSNMVDYLIGGVTIAERDMEKDLVEDAIKNCKSAARYGYGYAANYEGLRASSEVAKEIVEDVFADNIDKDIAKSIFSAYVEISKILYGTVEYDDNAINSAITLSLSAGYPYNIASGELDLGSDEGLKVICSIKLDINVLDTICKIVSMMVTCNQCLLQATTLNVY